MDYQDKTIACKDCGTEFIWSAKDQAFYADRGYSAPLYCKECREKRKQMRQTGQFGSGQHGSSRFDSTKPAGGQRYEITCSKCGKQDTVSFPVRDPSTILCTDCFYQKREQEKQEKDPQSA